MSTKLSILTVEGSGIPILGNDIDTDRIVPARFLKEVTFENMGEYLFCDARISNGEPIANHPLNQSQYSKASIMVVENNFGCGSSREHAPQAIKRAGFKAVIGQSFAEIFSGNCKAMGLVTATLERSDLDKVMQIVSDHPNVNIVLDVDAQQVTCEGHGCYPVSIKDGHRKAFLDGTWDALEVLKLNSDKIQQTAETLPYFNW
jgi:3-isopropylmalate/(R)-2-methylmalate dehydratase small subunit